MWNTEVFFGGRYALTYQIPVQIDYRNHKVTNIAGSPKFLFRETAAVRWGLEKIMNAVEFDESAWQKLIESNGNWRAIDIKIVTNVPVFDFAEVARRWRVGRVQVTENENGSVLAFSSRPRAD